MKLLTISLLISLITFAAATAVPQNIQVSPNLSVRADEGQSDSDLLPFITSPPTDGGNGTTSDGSENMSYKTTLAIFLSTIGTFSVFLTILLVYLMREEKARSQEADIELKERDLEVVFPVERGEGSV